MIRLTPAAREALAALLAGAAPRSSARVLIDDYC